MRKEKTLRDRAFEYMNLHPTISVGGLVRALKSDNDQVVKTYYYRWKAEIETLRWLYNFMVKKWEPVKHISVRDKERLKRVERLIGA